MDRKTQDLVRALCTRNGIIMEGEASTALTWSDKDPLTIDDRLLRLRKAGLGIGCLAKACLTLLDP